MKLKPSNFGVTFQQNCTLGYTVFHLMLDFSQHDHKKDHSATMVSPGHPFKIFHSQMFSFGVLSQAASTSVSPLSCQLV